MRPQWSASQGSAMDIKNTFLAANSALTDLVLRVRPEHLALEARPTPASTTARRSATR